LEAQFQKMLVQYPWIAYGLGYGPPPVPLRVSTQTIRPERHAFTLISCRKARERAQEKGRPIHPAWATSLSVMYDDVVKEIGFCPEDAYPNGTRVFTLDRFPKPARGYVPGNIRWADKSQQRDNQERNGGKA
jgi:hypothetical protein